MTKLIILALSFVMISTQAVMADVYRYVDKDGNVIFTDTPPEGAKSKKINIGQPTTETAFETPLTTTAPVFTQSNQSKSQNLGNYSIQVSTPGHNATINAPGGSLNMVVSVEPAPKSDFSVRFLVDGNEAATSSTPIATVEGLERGSHSFNAQLLAADGTVLATSNTNVVKILRPSVFIQRRNRKNNNEP